jgi:restriction endonuclease Mrr
VTSRNQHLSFKEAALSILGQTETPMSAEDIVEAAMAQGILHTEGKTPAATMAAQLYVDIRNKKKSKFRKVGKGKFALAKQSTSVLTPELAIEEQNSRVRKALLAMLMDMDPYQFEYLIGDLLATIGYEDVQVTRRSGDKGVDVVATLRMEGITDVKTVIQVKRFKQGNNLSGAVVTQLRGSAEVDQRGLVITTSDFTRSAREEARAPNKMPVSLVNGEKLVDLLLKHEVGVEKKEAVVYSIDEDYFTNVEESEQVKIDSNKNRGLWPLPGGADSYVETLFATLRAVSDGATTPKKLSDWFQTAFSVVKSEKTAYGYVNVPKIMGLTSHENGKVALTPEGQSILESKDMEELYDCISAHVLVFDDIVEYLKSSETPQSQEDILDFLREAFDIDWKTYAQVNFRLNWLLSLGKIYKTDEGYLPV